MKRKVECYHSSLYPTQWNQSKPEKWEGFTCDCGKNWCCPICGFGEGSYPCGCNRKAIKDSLERSLIENAAIYDMMAFEDEE
jgi:hypothetical protein